jgi:hypothetical protein
MAPKNYDSIAYSVLPALRNEATIVADLDLAAKGDATSVSKARIAEIELQVARGDASFRKRQFAQALEEFKTARALLYKLLYPGFDVGSFVRGRLDVVLPSTTNLEKAFLDVSSRMSEAIRPQVSESQVLLRPDGEALPASVQPFMGTGFREAVSLDETIQTLNEQAIALMSENKAAAAADLLQAGLANINAAGERVDPTLAPATSLNLAAARLQAGDARGASEAAQASLRLYTALRDNVGRAQALHLQGLAARELRDPVGSQRLLTEAAQALKTPTEVPGTPSVPAPPAGPIATGPVGPVIPRDITVRPPVIRPGRTAAVMSGISGVALQPALSFQPRVAVSRDLKQLDVIAAMGTESVTYRLPGRSEGWGEIDLPDAALKKQQAKPWTIGVPVNDKTVTIAIAGGQRPSVDAIVSGLYQGRVEAVTAKALDFTIVDTSTTTFYLTHLYSYALPVRMGDCFFELGQFAKAEEYFLVASRYSFLNKTVEATALWIRLARNIVTWGDSLYKREDVAAARTQYAKLIAEDGTVPNATLYTEAALATPATQARTVINNLQTRPLPVVDWDIAYFVLTASSRLQQILNGLDFYGLLLSPIHTFEYLQGVARAFAQEAIQAEREFINFKVHEELEAGTRRDLETTKAMADAEAQGRWEQYQAAIEDVQAAQKARALAQKRRDDAVSQRNAYAASSAAQIWGQAAAAALGGGEDAMWSEISELADKLARGETIHGPGPKLAAAQILYAGRKTRDYELKRMQDTIDELTAAIGVSQDQLQSAERRRNVAEIAWQAAVQRAQMAEAALDAFNNELFTPESWSRMASVMRDISASYLFKAIRMAKLMERSYNFENDTSLKVIKNDYGYQVGNPSSGENTTMFGGDGLLHDIDSFTYSAIASKTRKSSRLKDVISIASLYPAQFEAFRATGLLSIETDLYEFDRLHPGFFGQRLEGVEVQVVGLLPENGLNGTLMAGGVTRYRKQDGTTGARVHQVDTMAISNFTLRNDMFLYTAETGVRGLFQGLGLGTTWQLHLPKRSNDFDFRRIFDIQFVFYYTARFDSTLRTNMLAQPPRPGEQAMLRTFALRYDFPDAWYGFYANGRADVQFDRFRLPVNQQAFKIREAFFRVITKDGVSSQGIDLRLTGPNGTSGTVQTDANGIVSTESAALGGLINADPVGTWQVEVLGGVPLTDAGAVKFDRVYNIQLGLDYSFDYAPEVL